MDLDWLSWQCRNKHRKVKTWSTGFTTRTVCEYNPCYNNKKASIHLLSATVIVLGCPQTRSSYAFDDKENIYQKTIDKMLTNRMDLDMIEVVGIFMGKDLRPTYFHGFTAIDGNACVMPCGFRISVTTAYLSLSFLPLCWLAQCQ